MNFWLLETWPIQLHSQEENGLLWRLCASPDHRQRHKPCIHFPPLFKQKCHCLRIGILCSVLCKTGLAFCSPVSVLLFESFWIGNSDEWRQRHCQNMPYFPFGNAHYDKNVHCFGDKHNLFFFWRIQKQMGVLLPCKKCEFRISWILFVSSKWAFVEGNNLTSLPIFDKTNKNGSKFMTEQLANSRDSKTLEQTVWGKWHFHHGWALQGG